MQHYIHNLDTDKANRERLLQLHTEIETALEQRKKPFTPALLAALRTAMEETLAQQPGLNSFLEEARNSVNEHYHIHLTCNDRDILNLPWQLPVSDLPYCYLTKSSALKGGLLPHPAQPHPLKILVMIAAPEGHDAGAPLNYEEEETRILQAFEPLFQLGQVEIDFTDNGSLQNLEEKLRQNQYHILHFSGHGVYDEKTHQGYLQLEEPDTFRPQLVTATQFAQVVNINDGRPPALIFLSSCQTAQGNAEKGMRGVADELVAIHVPAVIAMSFSVIDFFATQFASRLYEKLASKNHLLESFQNAIEFIKQSEFEYLQQTGQKTEPGQWLIPQLYCSSNVEHLVNWTGAEQKLHSTKDIVPGTEKRLLLAHDKDYRFIGRRRELAKTIPLLKQHQPVLLTGVGGVGKTALAEHLLKRLMAADTRCMPFIFDETNLSAERVLQEMIKHLKYKVKDIAFLREYNLTDTKNITIAAEENANKNPNQQEEDFLLLLSRFQEKGIVPVFVFDNLESFQTKASEVFKPEQQDIITFIQALLNSGSEHLILTSRYPLKEFPDIYNQDIKQVHLNDFTKKYLQLSIREWAAYAETGLLETVKLLHKLLGGHYRTLEFLDTLYKENKAGFKKAMGNLQQLEEKLKQEMPGLTEELEGRAKGLVFEELLGLLQPLELTALQILTHYRRPELFQAVNVHEAEITPAHLYRLQQLTLIEKAIDTNTGWEYFYAPPLTRTWLATQKLPEYHFNHNVAGEYFEYIDKEVNLRNYDDLEEAFYHFYEAGNIDKVHEIGNGLSHFFDSSQFFHKALYYGLATEQLVGPPTHPALLNRIASTLLLFGKGDQALTYLMRCREKLEDTEDKKGLGATLNNISNIYQAKGDYDEALKLLLKSKTIQEEIGDKQGLSTTLNNISQIYKAKGDYDEALKLLLQDKAICEEIGDKQGLSVTLNNTSQIYQAKGDYDEALKLLLKSKTIREEIGDKKGLGTTLYNIAMIYLSRENIEQFFEQMQEAYRLFAETGNAEGLFHSGRELGKFFCINDYSEQGLKLLQRSEQIGLQAGFYDTHEVTELIARFFNPQNPQNG